MCQCGVPCSNAVKFEAKSLFLISDLLLPAHAVAHGEELEIFQRAQSFETTDILAHLIALKLEN